VNFFGARNFALRAWLDPSKLAAYGLTADDINKALAANDFISSLGNTKGQMVQVNLTASTGLHSLEEFRDLVIKQANGAIVRLSDVSTVVLGARITTPTSPITARTRSRSRSISRPTPILSR
jgi:multidrug efflux pump